jgi:hypothetical protein
MQGQWQGVQSTHQKQPVDISCDPSIKKKQDIFVHIYKLNQEDCLTATIYANQTGDFPYISSQGNRSIILLHHVNSNSFWVEPLKNQTEGLLIAAQTQALEWMQRQGIAPKHQILDNQCSARMKLAMESTTLLDGLVLKMTYKLVPPEDHQRNLAEKLIGTFKDHFIGVLSGCAKSSPCTCGVNYYHRLNGN